MGKKTRFLLLVLSIVLLSTLLVGAIRKGIEKAHAIAGAINYGSGSQTSLQYINQKTIYTSTLFFGKKNAAGALTPNGEIVMGTPFDVGDPASASPAAGYMLDLNNGRAKQGGLSLVSSDNLFKLDITDNSNATTRPYGARIQGNVGIGNGVANVPSGGFDTPLVVLAPTGSPALKIEDANNDANHSVGLGINTAGDAMTMNKALTSSGTGYSSFAGNLGIGTVTPSSGKIQVDSGSNNAPALYLTSSGSGWGSGMQFANTATGGRTYGIYVDNANPSKIHFADNTAGQDRMIIDNVGNVGIGSTLPNARLDIGGTSSLIQNTAGNLNITPASNLVITQGNVGIGVSAPRGALEVTGTNPLWLTTNANVRSDSTFQFLTTAGGAQSAKVGALAITSSYANNPPANGMYVQGSVGIGTTNPGTALEVNGSVRGNVGGALRIDSGNGTLDLGAQNTGGAHIYTDRPQLYLNPTVTLINGVLNSYSSADLALQTGGTTRMTIQNSTGRVGIGTASPGYTLDVEGPISGLGSSVFAQNNNTGRAYYDAPIQLREAQYGATSGYLPPRLSFHWGGVVASQLGIESDGTIATLNNPGTGYEKFKASKIAIGLNPGQSTSVAQQDIDLTIPDLYNADFRGIQIHGSGRMYASGIAHYGYGIYSDLDYWYSGNYGNSIIGVYSLVKTSNWQGGNYYSGVKGECGYGTYLCMGVYGVGWSGSNGSTTGVRGDAPTGIAGFFYGGDNGNGYGYYSSGVGVMAVGTNYSYYEGLTTSNNYFGSKTHFGSAITVDSLNGGSGQLRMIAGNYGAFLRNDGSNTYFLLTNSGDQNGSWNGLRPWAVNNGSGYVTFGNGHNDLAEQYKISGAVQRGSLVSISDSGKMTAQASDADHTAVIGVVSTMPGAIMDADGGFVIGPPTKLKYSNEKAPVALQGTAPTLVTMKYGGAIAIGDAITNSDLAGYGAKATKAGLTVGRALEAFNPVTCPAASSVDAITWPTDDGKNSKKPCFKLPGGTIVGKIMIAMGPTWYDPDLTMTTTGNLNITDADGNYQVKKDNSLVDRIGAFASLVVAKLQAGIIEAKKIVVNGVDILDRMNKTDAKVQELQQTVNAQQQKIEELEKIIQQLNPKAN